MTARERGSALPLVVAGLGIVLLTGAALGTVGALFTDHRHAESAADLAALAGAAAAQQGTPPCEAARSIAAQNGAKLGRCDVEVEDVVVTVVVPGPHWLGEEHDLGASARAGP